MLRGLQLITVVFVVGIKRVVLGPKNLGAWTLPSPLLPSNPSPLLLPFMASGSEPKKIFELTDARRRILEHFGHENLYLNESCSMTNFDFFSFSNNGMVMGGFS